MNESSFTGIGGLNIFTRNWKPEGAARAVVVISHGFNSHSGQYLWAGEQFANAGFAAYAIDHRGRGKSDGERFYVDKFTDFTGDLATFIDAAKAENPGLPVYLLGHSAGGVIACGYTIENPTALAGLICESFAFKLPVPDLVLAALKGVAYLAPHLHVFGLNNKDFSRDQAVVDSMNADPLIKGESQPAETAAEMIRADQMLEKCFDRITIPVLIMHGTEDKATRPDGSQFFYDHAGSADKTLKLYEGHYHDLLNDIDKEIVMGDIINWVNARIPAEQAAGA